MMQTTVPYIEITQESLGQTYSGAKIQLILYTHQYAAIRASEERTRRYGYLVYSKGIQQLIGVGYSVQIIMPIENRRKAQRIVKLMKFCDAIDPQLLPTVDPALFTMLDTYLAGRSVKYPYIKTLLLNYSQERYRSDIQERNL
jgi:hypothetical protein